MQFKVALSAAMLLLIGSAAANPIEVRDGVAELIETREALTAINADYACRGPNNANKRQGDSCAYKAGPSTNSSTIKGTCQPGNGGLTCIPK